VARALLRAAFISLYYYQFSPRRFVLLSIPFFARRDDFVGQVVYLWRIANPPALGAANPGCQSCLQPAFSQLLRQRDIRLPRIG
jgi:hypothetical protein